MIRRTRRHKQALERTVLDTVTYLKLWNKLSIKTYRSISKNGHVFQVQFKTPWRGIFAVKDALAYGPSGSCSERHWFYPIYQALSTMNPDEYLVRYGDNKIMFKTESNMHRFLTLTKKYDSKQRIPTVAKIILFAPKVLVDEQTVSVLSDENLMNKSFPQIYKPRAKGRFYIQAKPFAEHNIEELEKVREYCQQVGIKYSKYVFEERVAWYKERGRIKTWETSIWFAVDDLSMLGFLTLRNPNLVHKIYINSAYEMNNERPKEKTDQVS